MEIGQGMNLDIVERMRSPRPSRWLMGVAAGGFLFIVFFVGAALALLSREFQAVAAERQAVAYSQRVMDELGSILLTLREAHAAKRAYIMSGHEEFLTPYWAAGQSLPQKLQALNDLLRDDSSKLWGEQLQRDVQEQLVQIAQTIALYDQEGSRAAALPGMLEAGRSRMFATQDNVLSRRNYENQVSTNWIRRGDKGLAGAKTVALGSLLGTSLCLLLLGAWLVRQLRRHEQIEQRLKQSSAIWRETIDSIAQGVAVYDSDRRLMDWNRRYCDLRGIAPDKLFVGASIEHIHRHGMAAVNGDMPDSPGAQSERLRQVVETNASDLRDWMRADGLRLQVSARPMSGGLSVVTLSDVTAMRLSEAAARDQATRISSILDNVVDAIITFDEDGGIESWSRGAERMFGYVSEEILHRNVGTLMFDPQARQDGGLQRHMQNGAAHIVNKRLELEARRKDGTLFPIELGMSEMRIAGRRLFVGVLRDIAERRALERLKTEFISTVSHELRTPLTSIAGSLGLVTAGVAGELPVEAARLLAIAKKNSERLTRLINDILDLEKSEAGKIALQLQVQALGPIVDQAIEANRGFAESAGVRVELREAGADAPVAADAERLVQVLTNLLSNAVKFSPPQGLVRVVTETSGSMLKVAVHDDGLGIADEFRGRIFTRFAQADASDARHRSGTGLGLAIAKSLIENHGGRIDFVSGQSAVGAGQGATFWIELPRAQAIPDACPKSVATAGSAA